MIRRAALACLLGLVGCGAGSGAEESSGSIGGETTAGVSTATGGTVDASTSDEPTSHGDSSDGSTGAGDATSAAADSSTGGAAPRPGVLVYRGNGGEPASGDYFRFDLMTERLGAAGKTVTDTVDWPDAFDEIGLVLLVVNGEPFSAQQVADLDAVLMAGGVVVVHDEWSNYAESENLTALLAALGSTLAFEDALAADAGGGTRVVDGVADHALMTGVTSMVLAASSAVLGCDGGRELLSIDSTCLMAADAHGPGLLLAFGDADVLDDHVLAVADETQNLAFLENLIAALP